MVRRAKTPKPGLAAATPRGRPRSVVRHSGGKARHNQLAAKIACSPPFTVEDRYEEGIEEEQQLHHEMQHYYRSRRNPDGSDFKLLS
jgi:hypothetical protein